MIESQGASVVISHQILDGKQNLYEDWLKEIGPACRNSEGHIDWQIVRPIAHLTFTYTVVIRFDSIENLKNWMTSDLRKSLIEKVKPLLAIDDTFYIKTGLDFLFLTEMNAPKVPVRWKQYLVTWSAIYPLSLLIPFLVLPLLQQSYIPKTGLLTPFLYQEL